MKITLCVLNYQTFSLTRFLFQKKDRTKKNYLDLFGSNADKIRQYLDTVRFKR